MSTLTYPLPGASVWCHCQRGRLHRLDVQERLTTRRRVRTRNAVAWNGQWTAVLNGWRSRDQDRAARVGVNWGADRPRTHGNAPWQTPHHPVCGRLKTAVFLAQAVVPTDELFRAVHPAYVPRSKSRTARVDVCVSFMDGIGDGVE